MLKLLFIVFVFIGCGHALTEADIRANFFKNVMTCLNDHPVDVSELVNLKALIVPVKSDVMCLVACAHKKMGIMNAKGFYDLDYAYKLAEALGNGDEKRLKNARALSDECAKVNEVEVSDGDKGCVRAGLIFKCVVENTVKFGFTLPL